MHVQPIRGSCIVFTSPPPLFLHQGTSASPLFWITPHHRLTLRLYIITSLIDPLHIPILFLSPRLFAGVTTCVSHPRPKTTIVFFSLSKELLTFSQIQREKSEKKESVLKMCFRQSEPELKLDPQIHIVRRPLKEAFLASKIVILD